jgi:undecaprenyl-diphosphatase
MALIPGVSRSGATITTGLAFGLERPAAARFSFLLGVPAMFAAAAHEGRHLLGHPMDALTAEVFITGIIVSGLVGYATVKFFLRYLTSHSLSVFAWYRIALAAATAAWLLA